MRYFFEVSYKGSNYHGWQIQKNAISVQQVIQENMGMLTREVVEITGSGRTDTGVHAKQQYFHVDLEKKIDREGFRYHINAILPKDILVRTIREVSPEAHARFDARSRSYEYVMISQKDPFRINEAYIYLQPINLEKLNAASEILLGTHDFQSFSKVKTQVNNFICDVYRAYWQQNDVGLVFHIEANRFLRGMVRAIVGTMLMVNEGKIGVSKIHEILAGKNRSEAGRSVPPEGLYLYRINYPTHII